MVVRVCESERENREKRESCNDSSLAAIAAVVRAPKRAGSRVE
jgi:hypothetical protein